MQVNFNFLQQGSPYMNVGSINRGLEKENSLSPNQANQKNRDQVTLSPQGKMMSMIENLTKQKESINQRKSELIGKTLENGGDMDSISEQLKAYEEQLSNIDEQISQITEDFAKSMTEKDDDKKSKKADENKSAEQVETENLTNLANASESIKHSEIVSSVKSKVEGEVRVEKSEVKIREIQIDRFESKEASGYGNTADIVANMKRDVKAKEAHASGLSDKVLELDALQGEKINDAVDSIEKGNEAAKKPETEDKQDISAAASLEEAAQASGAMASPEEDMPLPEQEPAV